MILIHKLRGMVRGAWYIHTVTTNQPVACDGIVYSNNLNIWTA
jgi:hypothetical protein